MSLTQLFLFLSSFVLPRHGKLFLIMRKKESTQKKAKLKKRKKAAEKSEKCKLKDSMRGMFGTKKKVAASDVTGFYF